MTVLAIDPGKDGCLVAVNDEGVRFWLTRQTFIAKIGRGTQTDYQAGAMARAVREITTTSAPCTAFIERQGAVPKQGGVSNFTTGRGFGLWEGILAALAVPHHVILPGEWVGTMLKGCPGEGKSRSIFVAGRLYPEVSLIPEGCRTPADGLADALCLAAYGRRFLQGQT